MVSINSIKPQNCLIEGSRTGRGGWAIKALVLGTALFNAFLALANTHVHITSAAVILCEAFLDAGAVTAVLLSPKRLHWQILLLMVAILIINMLNSLGSQSLDPKFLRDVLIIPIFVLLGHTSSRRGLLEIVIPLQSFVFLVMIFEALRPEDFGRMLNVMSYYINTRGFEDANFWSQDQSTADLFISATRPGDRFLFAGLNIHRLSSVFLEPVSLGNYCVIITLIVVTLWQQLSKSQRIFFIVTNTLILIGCDGRFATVNILILILLRLVAQKLPRYINFFYLPALLMIATISVNVFGLTPGGDDFPTRTAGSVYMLSDMTASDLLGFNTPYAYHVMDSGIAYLLYSQSFIGALLLWSFIALGLRQSDRPSIIFSHGTSIYVALNLLISYSMFSIKTAGLLWFAYGAIGQLTFEKQSKRKTELQASDVPPR